MADTKLTATAEAEDEPVKPAGFTEAEAAHEFWQVMNLMEPKFREAWSIGSRAILTPAEKARVRAKLHLIITQLEYAEDLMS